MNYEDLFVKALSDKQVKSIVPVPVAWSEPGQTITGVLQGIEIVESDNHDFNAYVLHTDNGLVRVTLGVKYDKMFTEENIGGLYQIIYMGKKKSSTPNRETNEFDILYADLPPGALKGKSR